MNSTIFTTISGLPPLPIEGLVGTDKLEVEREGSSYGVNLSILGIYLNTLLDLNAILQYVLDNINLDPDLPLILEYVLDNINLEPDLPLILQYVLDNINLNPDLAIILQYVVDNLDVIDLQNFVDLDAAANVVIEYNPTNKRFIPSPRALSQQLANGLPNITWDRLLGHNAEILLTQDIELTLDNFIPGTYQLSITQDTVGNHTLDIVSNTHPILWSEGTWPTLSTAPNSKDTLTFLVPPSNSDIRGVGQFNFS
jgi:hypothetical protein